MHALPRASSWNCLLADKRTSRATGLKVFVRLILAFVAILLSDAFPEGGTNVIFLTDATVARCTIVLGNSGGVPAAPVRIFARVARMLVKETGVICAQRVLWHVLTR